VPATFFLIVLPSAARRALPARALAQGPRNSANHPSGVNERAIALSRPAFEDQLAPTEAGHRACRCPSPASWRWFRGGRLVFHRGWMTGSPAPLRLVLRSIFPWTSLRPPCGFMRHFMVKSI